MKIIAVALVFFVGALEAKAAVCECSVDLENGYTATATTICPAGGLYDLSCDSAVDSTSVEAICTNYNTAQRTRNRQYFDSKPRSMMGRCRLY